MEVKRASIAVEELALARDYFKRRLFSYEQFEDFLFLPNEEETPTMRYELALKAFKKLPESGRKGAESLYNWAYIYVNFKGWEKLRSRLRQQRRLDKKVARNNPRQTRDFDARVINRFNRVKTFLETDDNNKTLNYLIDLWEAAE